MALGVFMVIVSSLAVSLWPADADMSFSVTPTYIPEGLTPSFTLNCSFTNLPTTSHIVDLVSLTISKNGTNISWPLEEMASVNIFRPDTVILGESAKHVIAEHRFEVYGHSFLSLEWTNASVLQAGNYVCKAEGPNAVGHTIEETEWRTVYERTDGVDSDSLVQALQDAQLRLGNLERQMAGILQSVVSWASVLTYREKSFNASRYLLSDTNHVNDLQAALICGLQGGYLVEIDTLSEYIFLVDFLNRTLDAEFEGVLTGGNDWQQKRQWVWRGSGLPVTFTRWSAGSPHSYYSNRCIFLERGENWQMRNRDCSHINRYTFLCEVPEKRPL